MNNNKICDLLGIEVPIISGGMVWCSGWKLASAVSNNGGLGLIGAGSMHPETLTEHIRKCKVATTKPFGVNVPLLYPELDTIMDIIMAEKVPIVVTAAGSPKIWTKRLQESGAKVLHVVSSAKFASKSAEAGVDAVIAEGFEAGGHNGREETTTMALIPAVVAAVDIPVVAAGGIAGGGSMAAALALGADGVQIGTRFALTAESSANEAFKQLCRQSEEGDTQLVLKQLVPTRLLKNAFYDKVVALEGRGSSKEELIELLGRGRAKKGMFEGNLDDGELEIGQVTSLIDQVETVSMVMDDLKAGYAATVERLNMMQ